MPESRQWQLVRRPHGEPVADDARVVAVPLADPGDGEILVRNTVLSMDPY